MSGYEKNQNQESNGNNKESENDMETNQMQSEGKTGSTPPEFRGAYVELINSDKLIPEKKREQEKLEKDKKEQLKIIREKQKEKKEKSEKPEKTAKGKTFMKPKTEIPRLEPKKKRNPREKKVEGNRIVRTENRRKIKAKPQKWNFT
ncbi:hypothetical protein JTB14_022122 [Gonioctena quinquepunctata]|nr:hypothetical protein JTB14_022122 [Gonioctena quinquepunctata]